MKTKLFKIVLVTFLTLILLTSISKKISATNVLVVDMNIVDSLDTIYTCETFDSIKFIPCNGIVNNLHWFVYEDVYPYNNYTINADTIYISNNFSGKVGCDGYDGIYQIRNWTEIKPIVLLGEDNAGPCGSLVQLNVITNFLGSGNTIYSWIPTTGLSNPSIPNPTLLMNGDMEYTITMNFPNGCIVSKNINVVLQPMNSPSICLVSVDSTNNNSIYWEKPFSNAIDSFFIYKETNVTNVYKRIGTVGYYDNNFFIDTASFPLIQSNKYIISLKDSCDFESYMSSPHKTIHLTINQGQNNSWNLIWENYVGFEVSTYYIFRGTDSKNLQLIGTTAGSSSQYTDFTAPAGFVFYQIEVVSPTLCNVSDLKSNKASMNTSRSNIATNSPTGFEKITFQSNLLSCYPNPFNERIFIELRSQDFKNGTIEINDLTGKRLKYIDMKSAKNEINTNDLNNGLYILKIKTDKEIIIQKIVKN